MTTNHQKFMAFYGNKAQGTAHSTCLGAEALGESYVCPTVSDAPYSQYLRSPSKCGVAIPNMGRVAYCPANLQRGGGANLMYTATGRLTKSNCKACQTGGSDYRLFDSDATDYPGYYPDLTKASIGNRPVYSRTVHDEDTPNILNPTLDRKNDVNKKFNCHQPWWGRKCL